jgi:hypothetical protein
VPTVLIAPDHTQQRLRLKLGTVDLAVFSDRQVLEAVEAITASPPTDVVMERLFAATPRGAALIKRLKTDPALGGTTIRVLAHDSDYARVVPRPVLTSSGVAEASEFVDRAGTRAAPRIAAPPTLELQLDGKAVALADIAAGGAQVTSDAVLRPNQRVRVMLAFGADVVRVNATIVWAAFERSKQSGKPQYRAGQEFSDTDAVAVQRLMMKMGVSAGASSPPGGPA